MSRQTLAPYAAPLTQRPAPRGGTGGRILFVSATIHYSGMAMQTHVSVAKAGVDALSASTAIEYGPRGVTSNVVAPGPIAGTEGIERLSRPGDRDKSKALVPLGRYGSVKEIADATVYLFSDAGNFVNGEVLVGESRMPRFPPFSRSLTPNVLSPSLPI